MPFIKQVGETVTAVAVEKNKAGNVVALDPANAQWVIVADDQAAIEVVNNPDGSASIKGLAATKVTVAFTDTKFNLSADDDGEFDADNVPTSVEIQFS